MAWGLGFGDKGLGFRIIGSMVQWIIGSTDQRINGSTDQWIPGSMDHWINASNSSMSTTKQNPKTTGLNYFHSCISTTCVVAGRLTKREARSAKCEVRSAKCEVRNAKCEGKRKTTIGKPLINLTTVRKTIRKNIENAKKTI